MTADKKNNNDYDVLIVGASPASLVLALQLSRYNVKFQIIDKRSGFSENSPSFTLKPSTLDALATLNLADSLMTQGTSVRKINAYIKGKPAFDIDFRPKNATSYAVMLSLEQKKIETVLAATLQAQNHSILWNTELVNFQSSRDGVHVDIVQEGKKIKASTAWMVGCDGYDSFVREKLGTPFVGSTDVEKFLSADVDIQWGLHKTEGYVFMHPSDLFAAIPLSDGKYRVITMLDGSDKDSKADVAKLVEKFQKLVPVKGILTAPTRLETIKCHRRCATKLRSGRVFLLADAAHEQSALGDHDLNSGIHDAVNLGWKLGCFIRGWVQESYLDSYESERLKVAESLQQNTHAAMKVILARSYLGQFIRDVIAPLILSYPAAENQLKRILADSKASYGDSPITYWGRDYGAGIATRIKEGFLSGVFAGDGAPSFDLMIPKDFKRVKLAKLKTSENYLLLFMQGEKSKDFHKLYQEFQNVKKRLNGFAECYYIIGEHAVDYTNLDKNLEDVYIDPDGRGHQIYRCFDPTILIIRPDNYVCYRGDTHLNSLEPFLLQYFNPEAFSHKADEAKTSVNIAV